MYRKIVNFVFVLLFVVQISALGQEKMEFGYSCTYNSSGQVVSTSGGDWIEVYIVDTMYGSWVQGTSYVKIGNDWQWTNMPTFHFNSTVNGWNVYVCNMGYHSEYLYIKTDGQFLRCTFAAGGNGNYREYKRGSRPKNDPYGPTRR